LEEAGTRDSLLYRKGTFLHSFSDKEDKEFAVDSPAGSRIGSMSLDHYGFLKNIHVASRHSRSIRSGHALAAACPEQSEGWQSPIIRKDCLRNDILKPGKLSSFLEKAI